MQVQTVFRAGNSNVVAIPKDVAKELGFLPGKKVVVEKTESDGILIKIFSKDTKKTISSSEFKDWWGEFLEENSGILDELALR